MREEEELFGAVLTPLAEASEVGRTVGVASEGLGSVGFDLTKEEGGKCFLL